MKVNITITKEEATNLQWVLNWYHENYYKIQNNICDTDSLDLYEVIQNVLELATVTDEQDYSNSKEEYKEIKKKVKNNNSECIIHLGNQVED